MREGWRRLPLGEFLAIDVWRVPVDPTRTYRLAGVYSFGRGLFERDDLKGSGTSYTYLHLLRENQLVMSKLKAWEGAFAVVSSAFAGCHLSPEFPTYSVDARVLLPQFLRLLTSYPQFRELAAEKSKGMGGRKERVNPGALLHIEIDVPPLIEQRRVIDIMGRVDDAIEHAARAMVASDVLVRSVREEVFANLWKTESLSPVGQMVTRVRRPISVDPAATYSEIGVRSHGRGTFHKAPVKGAALAGKGIFSIEPNDLVFNIVFAWERAVAVASNADAGRCGSHRFPTYRAARETSVEFVHQALLSDRGHELMRLASPGSAGRNRTLSQGALMSGLIPRPGLDAQVAAVSIIEAVASVASSHARNHEALRSLRGGVLDSLLTGDHEVPDSYDRLLDGAA